MKNINQIGLEELTVLETRIIEGGAFNFEPMHIYIPKYPKIKVWNPKVDFNQVITWA